MAPPWSDAQSKLTLIFTTDDYSWSESYYSRNGTPTDGFANVGNIATARAAMLGLGANLEATRFVNLNNPRQALFPQGPGNAVLNTAPPPNQNEPLYADRPYSSVLVNHFAGNGYTKRTYYAGAPDLYIGQQPIEDRGIEQTGIADWRPLLVRFLAAMAAGQWGWQRQIWPAAPQTIVNITVGANPPTQIEITTAQPIANLSNSYEIIIRGFRRVNLKDFGMNGKWKINQNALPPAGGPYTYLLLGTPKSAGQAGNISGQGQVVALNLATTLFQAPSNDTYTYAILEATHRKRGSTLLAPRGRSKMRG